MTSDRTPSADADVCVVGAGPAGALVAHELSTAGHDVVVLEAGERFAVEERSTRMERSLRPGHDPTSVWEMGGERDAFTSSGDVDYSLNHLRVKGVGGSTLHWGGRVARFHPKDFEMQSRYGLAADWPIDYAELRPYYAAAERALGVAGADDDPHGPPRSEPYPMEAFPRSYSDSLFATACDRLGVETHSVANARNSRVYDGRSECVGYGTCSPVCPSGAKYSADVHVREAESEGARIVDRAVVQQLDHDDAGDAVTAAVYRTPSGQTHRQTADQFVLAAGGVENPRLLLLSRSDAHPDGLANGSGAVGRYFMEHPYVVVDGQLEEPTGQNRIGFGTMESHQFYEPDGSQTGSFKLEFSNEAGPRLVDLALQQREPLGHVTDLFPVPSHSELAAFREENRIAWGDELFESVQEQYGNHFRIAAELEPLPNPENRVSLNRNQTDAFGNPVPDVDFQPGQYVRRTAERAFDVMEDIVDSLDAPVRWSERRYFWGAAGHPSGTTRMGSDSAESVVGPNLRAHELENLYVGGSSTFVTIGANQPTLTIAATALRLADYLDGEVL